MTAYGTEAEAQTYFDKRLAPWAWDLATSANRNVALEQATLIIDRLFYKGDKTSSSQTNEFPRRGYSTIPDDIKYACYEIAYSLLDGVDPVQEFESLNISSQTYGNVKSVSRDLTYARVSAGVPSQIAWQYLAPYLRDDRSFRVERVG